MARQTKKLSALEIGRLSGLGKLPVGDSLYLQISKSGSKSWLFRYSKSGKTTWMGLGAVKFVTLAEARLKAMEIHRDLINGLNPLNEKIAIENKRKIEDLKQITFDECANKYIEAQSPGWKNKKHISQWRNTLSTYASPIIGGISVADIDTTLVVKILEPIWYKKAETANRLRGRLERVLSWAASRGYRSYENPARWRGHLDNQFPKRSSIQKVKHFKALPFNEVGTLIQKLRTQQDPGSLALEFVILTATRTNEALNAKWSEINLEEKYWLIPSERMKAGKEHKVPLSQRAIDILNRLRKFSESEFIFPGMIKGKPLSNMTLLMTLRRMKYDVTTHGFRSSFSDWAAEKTIFQREVVEMALAHTIKNKVEAAYRRGDLFIKRRQLMDTWCEFCSNDVHSSSEIINFKERVTFHSVR